MKKLFFAAAAVAAVISVSNADAKNPKKIKDPVDLLIHECYINGEIRDIKHDMLMTGNLWMIQNRGQKQIWRAMNAEGQDIEVKFKGNDYKHFVKAWVDNERAFVKDIRPVNRSKHVAKIYEDGEKHVAKDVVRANGTEIVSAR